MGCGASVAGGPTAADLAASFRNEHSAEKAYPLKETAYNHSGAPRLSTQLPLSTKSKHTIGRDPTTTPATWYVVSSLCFVNGMTVWSINPQSGALQFTAKVESFEDVLNLVPSFTFVSECFFILGLKVMGPNAYLLVATDAQQTSTLPPNHKIYTLTAVDWVTIALARESSSPAIDKAALEALLRYRLDGLHFCCESCDLTQPFPNEADPYAFQKCNEFVFNEQLRLPFAGIPQLANVCCLVVQGLAVYRTLDTAGSGWCDGDTTGAAPVALHFSMLVRKSCLNPGTRFNARGLNQKSAPGNEYECELVFWVSPPSDPFLSSSTSSARSSTFRWSSFVWRRGTIPLWWRSQVSGVAGISESLAVYDKPWEGSEWYFYTLLRRYEYFAKPLTSWSVDAESAIPFAHSHCDSHSDASGKDYTHPHSQPHPHPKSPGSTGNSPATIPLPPQDSHQPHPHSHPKSPGSMGNSPETVPLPPPESHHQPQPRRSVVHLTVDEKPQLPNVPMEAVNVDPAPTISSSRGGGGGRRVSLTHHTPLFGNVHVKLVRLDWHTVAKAAGNTTKAANQLFTLIQEPLSKVGFSGGEFEVDWRQSVVCKARVHSVQRGVMRVNCKDSLDRTNLICFWMVLRVLHDLGKFVHASSVVLASPSAQPPTAGTTAEELIQLLSPKIVNKVAELFLFCGDVCATLYTNSGAMHAENIRKFISSPAGRKDDPNLNNSSGAACGEEEGSESMMEAFGSASMCKGESNIKIGLRRIVENRYRDGDRQRAIELLLNQSHQTEEEAPASPQVPQQQPPEQNAQLPTTAEAAAAAPPPTTTNTTAAATTA